MRREELMLLRLLTTTVIRIRVIRELTELYLHAR